MEDSANEELYDYIAGATYRRHNANYSARCLYRCRAYCVAHSNRAKNPGVVMSRLKRYLIKRNPDTWAEEMADYGKEEAEDERK